MSSARTRRSRKLLVGLAIVPLASVGLGPSAASAHPLGNFSVNHLNTLTFTDDQVVNDVVIDLAEIPTAQDRPGIDADGDGTVSASEFDQHGAVQCAAFSDASRLTVDGIDVVFELETSSYAFEAGQVGLDTSRLECRLVADVASSVNGGVGSVQFSDGYRPGRVGWHEINALEAGSSIIDPPVPTRSVTNGLRSYPVDLLESPLDVRTVQFDIDFGTGATSDVAGGGAVDDVDAGSADNALDSRNELVASRPGALGGFVDSVQDRFENLIGRQDLTLGIGLLAIGLALVLGASHALLPGHGKTVMAAYIAGRQGSVRDAVLVGVTVTATHTGGVLLLGLGLTISTSLAGDTVLGWLGVVSGGLVAALGLALLISAVSNRGTGSPLFGHSHSHGHGPGGHTHSHDHHDDAPVAVENGPLIEGTVSRQIDHGDVLELIHTETVDDQVHRDVVDHHHDDHDHHHDHDDHDHHGHQDDGAERTVSRRGLVGMGVAGGLVPSPSALIVLLSAIALGRTWFGIVLVVGYGVGMAATLTAAGILLVKVRDRVAERMSNAGGRASSLARRWGLVMPYLTAALVLVVGLGLAIRSFTTL